MNSVKVYQQGLVNNQNDTKFKGNSQILDKLDAFTSVFPKEKKKKLKARLSSEVIIDKEEDNVENVRKSLSNIQGNLGRDGQEKKDNNQNQCKPYFNANIILALLGSKHKKKEEEDRAKK